MLKQKQGNPLGRTLRASGAFSLAIGSAGCFVFCPFPSTWKTPFAVLDVMSKG